MGDGIIRETRKRDGVSMQELADRLDVALTSVSLAERRAADGSIKLSTLRRMMEALGYSIEIKLTPLDGVSETGVAQD